LRRLRPILRATPPRRPKPLLPLLRQEQALLHRTTPLQHPRVIGVLIAFTDDLRTPQLELLREIRSATPLNVFGLVVRTLVRAAHYVDFVVLATWALAHELGDGGDAAVGCLFVGAEGERFDLRGC
jgi:hypothetical protein